MVFKEIKWSGNQGDETFDYEEIPDEELWEDGERTEEDVKEKIIYHVLRAGDWILAREVDDGK